MELCSVLGPMPTRFFNRKRRKSSVALNVSSTRLKITQWCQFYVPQSAGSGSNLGLTSPPICHKTKCNLARLCVAILTTSYRKELHTKFGTKYIMLLINNVPNYPGKTQCSNTSVSSMLFDSFLLNMDYVLMFFTSRLCQ